jgi:hypothetical protein
MILRLTMLRTLVNRGGWSELVDWHANGSTKHEQWLGERFNDRRVSFLKTRRKYTVLRDLLQETVLRDT